MKGNYSVNWYCRHEKKEKTSFFDTFDEAHRFITQTDRSPERMILEFNFSHEGTGKGNQ